MSMRFFPYLNGLVNAGASLVYLYRGEYKLALVWACYSVACFALGSIR